MTVSELIQILEQHPGNFKVAFETECCSTKPSGKTSTYTRGNGDRVLWFEKDWEDES